MIQRDQGFLASRRSALAGAWLCACGLLAGGARAAFPPGIGGASEADRWSRLIGDRFDVSGRPGTPLTLVSVQKMPTPGRRPLRIARRENFAAVFEAAAPIPGDATYLLSNPALGAMPIFFSSSEDRGGATRLVAILN
ncbi:MAG TPA: hypothetical protein VF727_06470 [Allosphingosinicella sp.]|jgi:hypothetical protein